MVSKWKVWMHMACGTDSCYNPRGWSHGFAIQTDSEDEEEEVQKETNLIEDSDDSDDDEVSDMKQEEEEEEEEDDGEELSRQSSVATPKPVAKPVKKVRKVKVKTSPSKK